MAVEVVDASWVLAHLGKVAIVDVRTPEEYVRGHIPGAIDVELPKPAPLGDRSRFIPALERAVPKKDAPVVVYCRSGVRAKVAATLMDQAGYGDIRLYSGSWIDWTCDPTRPVSHGAAR